MKPNRASRPGRPVVGSTSPCVQSAVDPATVVRSFLRGAQVSDAVVERLAASATIREHVGGHVLWTMGGPASMLMLIARGMVKLRRPLSTGEAVVTGLFGPRDAIGLIACLDGQAYPTDAVALSRRVVIVSIPVTVLHTAAASDTALARTLMVTMAAQARLLHEKIQIVSSGSVQARLALLLLRLADRYGDEIESGETCIPIDLTRKTMAEFIEARVETVIRALSAWRRGGVARNTEDGIVIAKLEHLREIALRG